MFASTSSRPRTLPQIDAEPGRTAAQGIATDRALELAQSPRLIAQRLAIRQAFGSAAQRKEESGAQATAHPRAMPAPLLAGIEALSGLDLSDVRVHTGSARPAALDALAYAQGSDIHLAPGQERQLPHEAWHVVQQRQGRVRATTEMAGIGVNDDPALEREADRMGSQAGSAMRSLSVGSEPVPAAAARHARMPPTQLRPVAQRAAVEVSKARADGPYQWTSKYQIDIREKEAVLTIRIDVVPDPGVLADDISLVKAQTRTAFQRYWDRRFNLRGADGTELPLRTQLDYTATNPHATVSVHAGTGHDDLSNWYVDSPSLTRAHELGHQLGMLDEYVDANAPNRATAASPGVSNDNSLMGNYYNEGIGKAHVQQRHGDTLATDIGAATGTAFTAVPSGIYIVRDGDTLEAIALRQLGNSSKWRDLYEKNQTVIGNDPNKIRPGMKLKL